jgi:chromate reductase, NAD(P)H dehydrogenase (quinone)
MWIKPLLGRRRGRGYNAARRVRGDEFRCGSCRLVPRGSVRVFDIGLFSAVGVLLSAMQRLTQPRVRLLTVCGSLQERSANRAAIAVASSVAAARGATVDDFNRLADIPAFNADLGDEHVAVVDDWRRRVDAADVVLVAAPEYAGGVAGAVKNAFDWLVGSGNMYRKPVGVISAGTSGGQHARRMTTQTLTWQGAYVVAELGITAPRTKSDDEGRFTDAPTLAAISSLTELLLAAAAMPATDLVDVARRLVGSLGIDAAYVTPGV